MALMLTSCGAEFYVDNDVADYVGKFAWKLDKDGYVIRKTTVDGKKGRTIRLHRIISNARNNQLIDHIDQNKRNNIRSNLRAATKSQNGRNKPKHTGKSQFKGVVWNNSCNKWQAQIKVSPGKNKYLGLFDDEHLAAHEYNKAAIKYHGDFACLNPVGVGAES